MILLAKSWKTVPVQNQRVTKKAYSRRLEDATAFTYYLRFDNCDQEDRCVRYLEHVMINIKYKTTKEPLLEIILCSPSKTCTSLLNRKFTERAVRRRSVQRDWNFTSVHFWGENPEGHWLLLFKETKHMDSSLKSTHLKFLSAELTIFGTSSKPYEEDDSVSSEQQKYPETVHSTKWYDKIVSTILDELTETCGKIFEDFSKTNDDDKLKSVDETSNGLTFYWVGIVVAFVVSANLFATLFSFRKNIWSWIRRQIYERQMGNIQNQNQPL